MKARRSKLWGSVERQSAADAAITLDIGDTHSPSGECCAPPAELAGRFETRTAPMVTWGGDADPAGALFG